MGMWHVVPCVKLIQLNCQSNKRCIVCLHTSCILYTCTCILIPTSCGDHLESHGNVECGSTPECGFRRSPHTATISGKAESCSRRDRDVAHGIHSHLLYLPTFINNSIFLYILFSISLHCSLNSYVSVLPRASLGYINLLH